MATKRQTENPEFSKFAVRIIRRLGERVGQGDVEGLALFPALHEAIDAAQHVAVTGLKAFGYSWTEIARPLKVSRQAAQMRYGKPSQG